jgi:hypothetical protein
MKYYIYGTRNVEYTISGIRIPKKEYSDKEIARGKKEYTAISTAQLEFLSKDKLFSKLLGSGDVKVTREEPDAVRRLLEIEKKAVNSGAFSPVNAKIKGELDETRKELKRAAKEILERDKEIEALRAEKR